MDSHSILSYSHKSQDACAVKVAVDPALLFLRFLVVSQTGDLQIDEVMNYELSPYPMSLFEAKNILRQPGKPQLAEEIKNYASLKSDNAVTQTVPGWRGAPTVQLQLTTPHSQSSTMPKPL